MNVIRLAHNYVNFKIVIQFQDLYHIDCGSVGLHLMKAEKSKRAFENINVTHLTNLNNYLTLYHIVIN